MSRTDLLAPFLEPQHFGSVENNCNFSGINMYNIEVILDGSVTQVLFEKHDGPRKIYIYGIYLRP